MRLFDVDKHHECASEEHVVFAFHSSDLSSEVFSQAVHETIDSIVIVLFVTHAVLTNQVNFACFDALNAPALFLMCRLDFFL